MPRVVVPSSLLLLAVVFGALQHASSLRVVHSSHAIAHRNSRDSDHIGSSRSWLKPNGKGRGEQCLRLRGGLAGPGMSGIPNPGGNLGFGTWQMPTSGLGVPVAGLASLVVAGQVLPLISKGTSHWTKTTRARIRDTYLYFGASCVMWVLSALLAWKTGMVPQHPLTVVAIFIATTYAFCKVARLDYETQRLSKSLWFFAAVALKGVVLSTIVAQLAAHHMLHLIVQALALTAAEAVTIAAVVAASPSTNFLWLAGPLAAGLGVLIGANLINLLFGRHSSVLHRAEAYFGALIFSGYLLVDTAKVLKDAQIPPGDVRAGGRPFDAIRHALQLYLDSVNLFLYILRILMDQEAGSRSSSSSSSSSSRSSSSRSQPQLRNAPRSTVYDLN